MGHQRKFLRRAEIDRGRDYRLFRARLLDLEADHEVRVGHHGAAERLSTEAEALRMTGIDREQSAVPRS